MTNTQNTAAKDHTHEPKKVKFVEVFKVLLLPIIVAGSAVLLWEFFSQSSIELTNVDAELYLQNLDRDTHVLDLANVSNIFVQELAEGGKEVGNEDTYSHDPRLIPALWLNFFRNNAEKHDCSYADHFNVTLPFSWELLLGLNWDAGCHLPADLYKDRSCRITRGDSIYGAFSITDFHEAQDVSPKLIVTGPVDTPFSISTRKSIGENYLLHTQHGPSKISILGITAKRNRSFTMHVSDESSGPGKETLLNLAYKYTTSNPLEGHISLKAEIAAIRETWPENALRSGYDDKVNRVLNPEEFDSKSLFHNISINQVKYFHEANVINTHLGSHYDWRFFRTTEFSNYERKVVLHRLAKAWLRFANSQNLKTWLAHGTLLGWYWNGMNLPWDQDIDVQMTLESLEQLAQSHNQTLVLDLTNDPDIAGVHSYFIDISPYFIHRTEADKQNVVDARFIDTTTGMYVDITALAISGQCEFMQTRDKRKKRLFHMVDENYADMVKSAEYNHGYIDMNRIEDELRETALEKWKSRMLYNCKDLHYYDLDEISPLAQTSFEGEVAYVPRDFKRILQREYPKGLTSKVYGDWVFRPYLGLWTELSKCSNDYYGDTCENTDILLEEKFTRPYRLKRGSWGDSVEDSPRVDPFLIRKYNS